MTNLERGLSIVLVAVVCTLILVGTANRDLNHQVQAERQLIKRQEALIDSLYGEAFNLSTQLGRVELTLDHLQQVDPKGFAEFNQYFNHQTE